MLFYIMHSHTSYFFIFFLNNVLKLVLKITGCVNIFFAKNQICPFFTPKCLRIFSDIRESKKEKSSNLTYWSFGNTMVKYKLDVISSRNKIKIFKIRFVVLVFKNDVSSMI